MVRRVCACARLCVVVCLCVFVGWRTYAILMLGVCEFVCLCVCVLFVFVWLCVRVSVYLCV